MAKNMKTAPAVINATDFDAMAKALKEHQASQLAAHKAELEYHMVTVTGGRKFKEGTTGECIAVTRSRFGINARVVIDGGTKFINPEHLTAGKPLSPARRAALEAEREAASEATVTIDGTVIRVTDGKDLGDGKTSSGSVLIRNSGWYKPVYFAKSHCEVLGDYTTGTGNDAKTYQVFEVPQWKVRKECGQDALDAAIKREPELLKKIKSGK